MKDHYLRLEAAGGRPGLFDEERLAEQVYHLLFPDALTVGESLWRDVLAHLDPTATWEGVEKALNLLCAAALVKRIPGTYLVHAIRAYSLAESEGRRCGRGAWGW